MQCLGFKVLMKVPLLHLARCTECFFFPCTPSLNYIGTGKSMSEAFIFASNNPQYELGRGGAIGKTV